MSCLSIAKNFIHLSLSRSGVILLTICVFADLGLSSPLVFKVTRTIDTIEYVELGAMDATLSRQIRIGVNITSTKQDIAGEERAQGELNTAKRELSRNLGLLNEGVISSVTVDESQDRVEAAQRAFDSRLDLAECQLEIVGVVDNEEVILKTLSERVGSRSFVIESPPATIKFKGKGKGKFSVYVWVQ